MAGRGTENDITGPQEQNDVTDQKKEKKMADQETGAKMADQKTEGVMADRKDLENNANDDAFYRVLFCGNTNVGKSSLLTRLTDDSFSDQYSSTADLDFKEKTAQVGGRNVVLQMWDMGGKERSSSHSHSFYRDAHAVLILYDVTNQESYDELKDWLKEIRDRGREDVEIFIVGNKSDEADARVVHVDTAQDFAHQEDACFFEVSAKTGHNVEKLFNDLVFQLLVTSVVDLPMGRMQFAAKSTRVRRRYWRSACCSIT